MSWPVSPQLGTGEVNYPRNTWWVAARADEVTREPLGVWILDRPVLLYRQRDGSVAALDDRCPHRWAPLSKGRIVGDDIECPYHGITFSPNGECVRIPSQAAIASSCKVRSYPVIESKPFVWIWMGDPERMREYDPPHDLSWAVTEGWSVAGGLIEMEGNYMQLHDNVLDLTHFGFVHRDSLGVTDWIHAPKMTTSDTTVTFRQEFLDRPQSPFHTAATNSPPGRLASRFVTEGSWISPALEVASETVEFNNVSPGERSKFTFQVAHATTPISMNRYRYYFLVGWDVVLPREIHDAMGPGVVAIFSEDKGILQAISELVARDSRGVDYPEIRLAADAPQLHARKKLAELLAREAKEPSLTTELRRK